MRCMLYRPSRSGRLFSVALHPSTPPYAPVESVVPLILYSPRLCRHGPEGRINIAEAKIGSGQSPND